MTTIKIMIKSKIMRDACEDAARAGRWIAACHTHGLRFELHARVLRTNCGRIMRMHFCFPWSRWRGQESHRRSHGVSTKRSRTGTAVAFDHLNDPRREVRRFRTGMTFLAKT